MTTIRFILMTLLTVLSLGAVVWGTGPVSAEGDSVEFPQNYADGVHYGTVERGNIREELFASRAAIEAAKRGEPFPYGTVVTLVDYRDGALYRYVVMEKRAGWGADHPADIRTGEWRFQAFGADRSVNESENLARCMSCHKPREAQDFVFTVDLMKRAD